MVGPSNLTWQQAYMVDHPISHGALFSLEYQGIRLSWFSSYLFPLFNLKPLGCPSSLLYMHQWGGVICLHIMCTPIVPNFCPLFDSSPRASSLIYPNTCWHLYLLSELTCSQTPVSLCSFWLATLAFLMFLQHRKHTPSSRLLHLLLPLPSMPFSQTRTQLISPPPFVFARVSPLSTPALSPLHVSCNVHLICCIFFSFHSENIYYMRAVTFVHFIHYCIPCS